MAYLACTVLLIFVFIFHYVGLLEDLLGENYANRIWRFEILKRIFFPPLLGLFILQTLLFSIGYLGVFAIIRKRSWYNEKVFLIALVALAWAVSGIMLGGFEPLLSTDYFEYGIRQELNAVFEFVGYTRINVTVYTYLTLTAILTWFFVKRETNKTEVIAAPHVSDKELLDD